MRFKSRTVLSSLLLSFTVFLYQPENALASSADVLSLYEEGEEPGGEACGFLEELAHGYPQRMNNNGERTDILNEAGEWVHTQLESFGYEVVSVPYTHQPDAETSYSGVNYAVLKPGEDTEHIIVVGGHYDCVDTEGADDNASGVSCVLEMARHFKDVSTPCSIIFALYDNEEHGGYVGSFHFIQDYLEAEGLIDKIIANITIDSVGGGDRLFAYGGYYDESDELQQEWVYLEANRAANRTGTPLYTLPEYVEMFKSPTRTIGSDHHYFYQRGIPYIYMEASRWCLDDGTGGNEHTHLHYHFQTADPRLEETGGQIMHTRFDNYDLLNEYFPGRFQENLGSVVTIVSSMLLEMDAQTEEKLLSGELSLDSFPEDEPSTEESETTEPETETPEAEISTEAQTARMTEPGASPDGSRSSASVTPGDHKLVRTIFIAVGAALILLILFLIYWNISARRRRKKHIHRMNQSGRSKKKF